MRPVDEISARFRAHGLRVTPQREAIFRLLEGNQSHPTVDSLYDAVREEIPSISLKTVYQTVHDLDALGEVELLDLGTGSVRVDPNVESRHHHLVCTVCGRVRDLSVGFDGLSVPPRYRRDFTVDSVEVIVRGTCDGCR
jgi:Fe2+ or Zn2+ uptake regulation protein